MLKKILFIFILLSSVSFAQQKSISFWSSGYSTYAKQYFDRYDVKPQADTLKKYAEFIDSLVANGCWQIIDEMWIFANNTQSNALLGVKGYKNCTAVNSPTFVIYRGMASNGTTSYINTNYNPVVDKITLTTNALSMGVYSTTNSITAGRVAMGNKISSNYLLLFLKDSDGKFYYDANVGTDVGVSVTTSRALMSCNRSDASNIQAYQRGVQIATSLTGTSSLNNISVYILAYNNNGTAAGFDTRQISFAYIGGGMTAQQHLNLYNCLQRLLTYIGANV